jgi:hypothetical protein
MGYVRIVYTIIAIKIEGKIVLGSPMRASEDNIKMYHKDRLDSAGPG